MLLRSDKGVANFSDRSLLKNLGHWMGMLTLAKNKPILYLVRLSLQCMYYFFDTIYSTIHGKILTNIINKIKFVELYLICAEP